MEVVRGCLYTWMLIGRLDGRTPPEITLITSLGYYYQFSFRLRLHRLSLQGCHVMNERLKPEDLRDELINSLSGSDWIG